MNRIVLLPTVCLLTACAYQRQAMFVDAEYAPYNRTGDCVIAGRVLFRSTSGDVKNGSVVHLNPVTAYSTEYFEQHVLGGRPISPPDSRTEPFERTMRCDADGRFRFEGLAPGEYYLHSYVAWFAPIDGVVPPGGYAYARVRVGAGQTAAVMVTADGGREGT